MNTVILYRKNHKNGMAEILKKMNEFTAPLYCKPVDADSGKREWPMQPTFQFIVGNYTDVPAGDSTSWRMMPFALCTIPLAPAGGRTLLEVAGRPPLEFSPGGEAILIPEGVRHRISNLAGQPVVSLWLHFRLTVFHVFSVFEFFDLPLLYRGDRAERLREKLDTMVRLPKYLNFADSLTLQLSGLAFGAELLAGASCREVCNAKFEKLQRFRRVFETLAQLQPGQPAPSSAELAELVSLSRSRFLALFHELTGGSPTVYLERKRFRDACNLLLGSAEPLARIAEKLGYADAFHFSRKFKLQAGISPQKFRQQLNGSAYHPPR